MTINMLLKNEDNLIKSLWGVHSVDPLDKFTDIMLYFCQSKSLMECSKEWSSIMEYQSKRCKQCICGRENNKIVYILNNINGNILRIGKECIYKFRFSNNKCPSVGLDFIPLEDVCIKCKKNPIPAGKSFDENMCSLCYDEEYSKDEPVFPLSNFLFKMEPPIKIPPPPPPPPPMPASWSKIVEKSSPKIEEKSQKHVCKNCSKTDGLKHNDTFCIKCYRIRQKKKYCMYCDNISHLFDGICYNCSQKKR